MLPVPDELAMLHLEFINSVYGSAVALEEIELTTHSPQIGFFAAAKYANFRSKRSQAVVALTQYYNGYTLSLNQE